MRTIYEDIKEVEDNTSITENGAIGYKTTNSEMVDFLFKLSSFRNDDNLRKESIDKLFKEKDPYLLKFLFYIRDAREGLGERETFRQALKRLEKEIGLKDMVEIIRLVPEYGRWDDLFVLIGTESESIMMRFIEQQLNADLNSKNPSLLAKWMPSINASSEETKEMARKFIKFYGLSQKQYRKILSGLRAKIDVVEKKMCAKRFGDIDYNKVPSKANILYGSAFLRNDETRRREYLNKLSAGDTSVKINSSVNFPSDVVRQYGKYDLGYHEGFKYDQTLELLWKNLKEVSGLKNTIVVRDGSGSMCGTPLEVADALSIYCAQHNETAFKNKFITFSATPKLIDFSDPAKYGSLASILTMIHRKDDCSNTNLTAVFDLVLRTARTNHYTQKDIPSQILIISDMEFDQGCDNIPLLEEISEKWSKYGYKLPKLIFWNVSSRTCTIPIKENENGVLLISGFSQNVINMINNGEVDPYKSLVRTLSTERYEKIKKYI